MFKKGQIPWNKMFSKEEELQICNMYIKNKLSTLTLAKKEKCSATAIDHIIKRNGYDLRNSKFLKEEELQICKEYFLKEKPSAKKLAEKWNCSEPTISNVLKRNGYKRRPWSEVHGSLKDIQQALKNGYGTKCYYKGEFFPSKFEKDCVIRARELGFKVEHNFLGRFDAKAKKGNFEAVMEFHMFVNKGKDRNGLTHRQYYYQRRKLLNEYGYKNLKLVVIKDLKEIETIKRDFKNGFGRFI